MSQEAVPERIKAVRDRIARAAAQAGRDPEGVALLVAAKGVDAARVGQAVSAGVRHVGENRVQEAEAKLANSRPSQEGVTLHLIGGLQTNKVRRSLQLFDVVQSVGSGGLAMRLEKAAGNLGLLVPVYIQVNVGMEPSKGGVAPPGLLELAELVGGMEHLRLEGLMTVPPYTDDPERARPFFRAMREMRDAVAELGPFRDGALGLSMGMSHDFEVAVEEGATMVRLGRAIWDG